jgi:hypothetical protein
MLKRSGNSPYIQLIAGCVGTLLLGTGCEKTQVPVTGPITNNVAPSSRIHFQGVALARAIETYRELVTSPVTIEIPEEVLRKPISAGPFNSGSDDAALLLEASFREQAQVVTARDADGKVVLRYDPVAPNQK